MVAAASGAEHGLTLMTGIGGLKLGRLGVRWSGLVQRSTVASAISGQGSLCRPRRLMATKRLL